MQRSKGLKHGLYATESHILNETIMKIEAKLGGRKRKKFTSQEIHELNEMIVSFAQRIEDFFENKANRENITKIDKFFTKETTSLQDTDNHEKEWDVGI